MTDQTKQELYPNVYRIQYQEFEGDHREGGFVEKVTYIEDISLLRHYRSKITQVVPISATFLPELSSGGIEQLFEMLDAQAKAQQADELNKEIKDAEAVLAKLKGKRND